MGVICSDELMLESDTIGAYRVVGKLGEGGSSFARARRATAGYGGPSVACARASS